MGKTFNMEMNIAKAIAMTAIIADHTGWNLLGDFLPDGSWHVPLFFFISGYFFNINKDWIQHIKNIIIKYLGWFYGYHFFYGGITVLVFMWLGKLYGKMPSLKTLTVSPFDSNPFMFSVPNWFLLQLAISLLFFTLIMYLFKKFTNNKYFPAIIFVPLGIVAVFISKPDFQPSYGIIKVLIKTFITMFYIYAGWLYRNKLENKIQYNGKWLTVVILIQLVLFLFCRDNGWQDINNAKLRHNISPFTTVFTGIYLVLFPSKILAPAVKEGSVIDKTGRNTLHIMANHTFIIFLIQLGIYMINGIAFKELPDHLIRAFYKMERYNFLYTFGSLIICTYIGEFINYIAGKIRAKRENISKLQA